MVFTAGSVEEFAVVGIWIKVHPNLYLVKDTIVFNIDYNNMARAFKYITPAVIGQNSGPDFSVMPTSIMNNVNGRLVRSEYRKCESTFDSNSSNNLKLNETRQFL